MQLQDWLDAGYKRFNRVQHYRPYAEFGLQKKITDPTGLKYFITVFVYDYGETKQLSFSPEIQVEVKDCFTANSSLILSEHSTIQQVEDFFDMLWKLSGSIYEELYE